MAVKILVVDDEPDLEALMIQKFRKKIKENEYSFIFARNGIEALEKLQADLDIHVVLTDLNMPEMDGLTFLDYLFKMDRIIKAVVVSAYGDMSNIRCAMNRGASDFILKPIDFQDLEITINKMIEQYGLLNESLDIKLSLRDLEKELEVAKEIQQSMLPADFFPLMENKSYQIYGKMIPAKQVGGDFFDFFPLGDHKIGLVIADVSGKNISASLFMAISKALLHYIASQNESPLETIRKANDLLCYKNDSAMFVTTFYAIIDLHNGELRFCNAGHNSPFVLSSDGKLTEIGKDSGLAMGIYDCEKLDSIYPFVESSIILKPNDKLIFYTDGVTEAMNIKKELYLVDRLKAALKNGAEKPLPEMVQYILSDIRTFTKDVEQSDDITLMCFSYQPVEEDLAMTKEPKESSLTVT